MSWSVASKHKLLRQTFVAHAEFHDRLTSTNDRAIEALRHTLPLPLLIVAGEQTEGRGRGNNRWWTGRDNLAFSLAIDPARQGLSRSSLPLLSLAAALALIETVRPHLKTSQIGLHWPNDVYLEGRKLSGVLVECPAPERAILGVGVNVNTSFAGAPPDLRRRATSLREVTGRVFDRIELLVWILQGLEEALDQLAREPDAFGRKFDRLCLQHGQTLAVHSGNGVASGRCEGIAPDGALLLATSEGTRRVYSGALVPPQG